VNKRDFFKDGGYKSRKLWLAILAMLLIILSTLICPAVTITDVVAGIVAIVTVYMGGNAVSKWTTGKALAKEPEKEPEKEEGC
jgi:hypothetical protein